MTNPTAVGGVKVWRTDGGSWQFSVVLYNIAEQKRWALTPEGLVDMPTGEFPAESRLDFGDQASVQYFMDGLWELGVRPSERLRRPYGKPIQQSPFDRGFHAGYMAARGAYAVLVENN